VSSQAAEQHEN
jgi:hypothetical protein